MFELYLVAICRYLDWLTMNNRSLVDDYRVITADYWPKILYKKSLIDPTLTQGINQAWA